ncbi:NADP-dependent succinate-semialdehyde dehydrogenase [Shewanella submarina]|uniref:NADP-dependent succinate-semialdehyde dehydrogenase n=1 Tax=Shewanella submarina TaxID=2016376 RepID=A0ABV7GAU1_9GAMM|nr:NADP-dependent succinate-semialdehyde dehydrogenase [Shewanella submarina]MCL1037015.1 NADP-dependent succinate-semialdehyde dehydrogenase [Shewanella submarina]
MQLNCSELFRQQAFINGHWCDALGGQSTQIHNPADNSLIGFVPVMGKEETRRAIDAANCALPAWRAKTAVERAAILRRWFNLMLEHQDDLAQLITAEQGKPLSEAQGEVKYAASFMEWFAEEGKRAYGETIPGHQADKRIMVLKQPIGVCAAITPWNFPAAMITRKLAPALAAGCTMVLKPAPQTPYTALALAQLGVMAGIPEGVFNVVTGDAIQIGDELCANPVVRKLSFTGSTGVGAHLMANCAPHIKKLSLELGGNAPFIVFDDADIDAAVAGAMIAKFRNNGQTCVCANRIYVQQGVYDEFAAKLTAAVSALKVGRGTDTDVTTGPLINQQALDKVQDHIQDALSQGATLACGGQPHALGGLFFEPTVITGVKPGMKLTREETFGPVAGLIRFTDTEEVIAAANDTEFGLAAYFYSQNLSRVWQVSEALEYGMVGINTGLISTEVAPFGGIKSSGLGREGSRHGLDEYMELKYLCVDIS